MPSEKILQQKKAQVAELAKRLNGSLAGVVVSFKGITVAEDTELRKKLRESGISYTVIKNTLLDRAAKEAGLLGMEAVLTGTTALATSESDYVAAAKIICEFAEGNKAIQVKSGFVEGKVIGAEEVKALAKLPSRDILIAQTLGTLQAPITGLVTVLSGTIRAFALAINAIAEKKSA